MSGFIQMVAAVIAVAVLTVLTAAIGALVCGVGLGAALLTHTWRRVTR